jgi:hypothetical protein
LTNRWLDPTGKGALFEGSVEAAPDQLATGRPAEGKAALFSSGRRQAGTVLIECSACKSRTRASIADLGLRLATGSAWIPLRRHAHWMRCPACGRREWCRIGWNE